MNQVVDNQSKLTYDEIENVGEACDPMEFPSPCIDQGIQRDRVPVVVVSHVNDEQTIEYWDNIIYNRQCDAPNGKDHRMHHHYVAYKPQQWLEKAVHGQVLKARVLKPHSRHVTTGEITLWEATDKYVAIKQVTGTMIIPHGRRSVGRYHLQEDPLKEIAALQMSDGIIYDNEAASSSTSSALLDGADGHHSKNMRHNVMSIMEVLYVNESFFIVMPYCPDKDLSYMLNKTENGMAEPLARHFFRSILKALRYLRTKGICHRDISPENILLDENQCYLTDFGLSLRIPYRRHPLMWCRPYDPTCIVTPTVREDGGWKPLLIQHQIPCGKPNCIAPEVVADSSSSPGFDGYAIDLWAAGSILYKMLTGNYPYRFAFPKQGDKESEFQWDKVLKNAMMRLHKHPHISLEAKQLLSSMLVVNPRHRLTLHNVMDHPWVQKTDVIRPQQQPLTLTTTTM